MTFWKPGTTAPGSDVPVGKGSSQLDRENESETPILVHNPNRNLSLQQQRLRLPIFQNKKHILYLVEKYPVVIIVGETGCGKTTQIPQYLYECGWAEEGKVIGCTQPRRIAATSVAARVAEEMGVTLGSAVGYSIRFDEKYDERTRIKYMTDGMLLRETMVDPLLSKYSVIMIDEAHERSLYTDVILGLLKKIQKKRPELRLIISSATMDAQQVKDFFNTNKTNDRTKDNVFIMSIEGRTYPVDILFSLKPVADYLQGALEVVLDIHKFEPAGDILVFLTGQEEIDTLVELIRQKGSDPALKNLMKLRVLPLYAGLPSEAQNQIFEPAPPRTRKVIVSTNIAETSVTIDGIVYVVDSGFVKIRTYNPRLGAESLIVTPIPQSTANQRAGRAGRNRPGKCFRLFTQEDFAKLPPSQIPEIQRTNLAPVVIQLKALGIDNILNFDFMAPPPVDHMIRALDILYSLGCLDDDCKLTDPVGIVIAEFPVGPLLAKILVSSGLEYGCSEEILSIAAMLSIQQIYSYTNETRKAADQAKKKFIVYEGDHITLLNIYTAFLRHKKDYNWCRENFFNYKGLSRAVEIRDQLRRYLRRFNIPIISCAGDADKIRKCLVSGFFAHAALRQPDGSYTTVRGNHRVLIHPTSVLYNRNPEWIIYHEIVQTEEYYVREVTKIEPAWLTEIAPHFYDTRTKSSQHAEKTRLEEESPDLVSRFRSIF